MVYIVFATWLALHVTCSYISCWYTIADMGAICLAASLPNLQLIGAVFSFGIPARRLREHGFQVLYKPIGQQSIYSYITATGDSKISVIKTLHCTYLEDDRLKEFADLKITVGYQPFPRYFWKFINIQHFMH